MSFGFWRKKRVFALLFITFVILLFISSDTVGRLLYPIQYEKEIRSNAEKYEVDPLLVAAIIRVESNYKTNISSKKGAFGLMQLMPETSDWIVEAGKFDPEWRTNLDNPSVSIQLGTWYLSYLHKQFKGNQVAVIAGYNAGQGKVARWLQNEEWDGTLHHTDDIPYGETRHYIQRVLYYYNKYYKLYSEEWGLAGEKERSIGQAP
ncbi:lytic transglycosylase domain-containing protein [Paenibacillus rigui]|uniref:Lytic transglycosylase n=1 Tax=Paenibacillus rigui TaxID=554312 RepID=A0A229ULT1_9BACL|nr:lytic transglycosylase domain-containing protein [Paenibacillus rigui]OXM84331.1 lytic transglycosylase [Paenibacillus rigui]